MIHALELPWGFNHPKVKYYKEHKIHVYKGSPILPAELRPFRCQDFSIGKWHEDEINGLSLPPEKGTARFTPRQHQIDGAQKIVQAYGNGHRGFLLSDGTGIGKTLTNLVALTAMAQSRGFGATGKAKTLIVCPKSVIPQWRNTLRNYPISTAVLRPLVINYQQLNKLLQTPPNARFSKNARTKTRQVAKSGDNLIDWDYVIFDESQYLKNYPTSTTSVAAVNIAKLDKVFKKDASPFVIFSTATPGSSPLNMAVMSGIIAPLIASEKNKTIASKMTPAKWADFLIDEGFSVKKGKSGYTWATVHWFGKNSDDPKEKAAYEKKADAAVKLQKADSVRIGKGLISKGAPFIMRKPENISGWPTQQYIPFPIELSASKQTIYLEAWTRFRKFLNLAGAAKDPKGALVENLRYRQKASLIKVDAMIDQISEWVDDGKQVYVSCEFMDTIDRYRELLEKKKISVAEVSGRNESSAMREYERIRFQKGEAQVVLCTVVAGVSLHQEEILPDGTKASKNERISLIHSIRQNPEDAIQTLGRAMRDGKNSLTYFPYIEKTVEEKIIESFTNKIRNSKTMLGEEASDANMLERIFAEAAAKSTDGNRMS